MFRFSFGFLLGVIGVLFSLRKISKKKKKLKKFKKKFNFFKENQYRIINVMKEFRKMRDKI